MTHRELQQGIKERMWEISNWPTTDDLKEEVYRMQDQLHRMEGLMALRVCRRAICTFDLGHTALQYCEWDEDVAVLWLMTQRSRHYAA